MDHINIVEVGPRDGLQNESKTLSPQDRIWLIKSLSMCGFNTIEAGAFVSPKAIPQMNYTDEVLKSLNPQDDTSHPISYPVLVPNMKGFDAALKAGAKEIAIFTGCSETFTQKNINCTIEESLARFSSIIPKANASNIKVRAYVSTVWGCPYEGSVSLNTIINTTRALLDIGCYEVSLGDTIGVGTPGGVKTVLTEILKEHEANKIAVHFHDTYGQALANILQSMNMGIRTLDSAVGGLGGCPYAPGASGNVSSEDLIYMLHGMGIKTGINLDKLQDLAIMIETNLGINIRSKSTLSKLIKNKTIEITKQTPI